MNKHTALVATAALSALLLTGCDDGPGCAEWRTEARLVTVTTLVNGKPHVATQLQPVTYCARYEEPTGAK